MGNYLFITNQFKEKIDTKNWNRDILKFLENPHVDCVRLFWNELHYVKSNTGRYPRLILMKVCRGRNSLMIPRHYLSSHEEYDIYRKRPYAELKEEEHFSDEEKQEIDNKFSDLEREAPLPVLPDEMRVEPSEYKVFASYIVEMKEWCHTIDSLYESHKIALYKYVKDAIYNDSQIDDEEWFTTNVMDGRLFLYRHGIYDDRNYVFLFGVHRPEDIDDVKERYRGKLSCKELLSLSIGGYPDWVLETISDWEKVEDKQTSEQNNDRTGELSNANILLSPEEIEALNKVKYPFFLTGLAGSGKSTLLHYLFVLTFAYNSKNKNNNKNKNYLFLSYSQNLTEKAKTAVKKLMQANPQFFDIQLSEYEKGILDNAFVSFIIYLKNEYLQTEEEKDQFLDDNHIDYNRFVTLFDELLHNRPKNKLFKPEIVWAVIRSFIKGRKTDESEFTMEDYEKLSRNDHTIPSDLYEEIYQFYRNVYWPYCDEKNYWDDLDLIRYVINKIESGDVKRLYYDYIFCDEAQDFTPMEIQLIIQMSKYSNYRLVNYETIPMLFAGDPNQTVSPTGFRWASLKSVFNSVFMKNTGYDISLKTKTLAKNYRSSKTIIQFANCIESFRVKYLHSDDDGPQDCWRVGEEQSKPFYLIIDFEQQDNLVSVFTKASCIITGLDGEGKDFDDELIVQTQQHMLYTAQVAKGLEFDVVLLYRFADQLPDSFEQIMKGRLTLNESEMFELSHFFTKLYIAVTRAKNALYVIDSKKNFERFWYHFVDGRYQKWQVDLNKWANSSIGLSEGDWDKCEETLTHFYLPGKTADHLFEVGISTKNASFLYRCINYYQTDARDAEKRGDEEQVILFKRKAIQSKAYAYWLDRKRKDAGIIFEEELGDKENSFKCFWEGLCWEEIEQYWNCDANLLLLSQFMLGKVSIDELISTSYVIDNVDMKDNTWRKVVQQIYSSAMQSQQPDLLILYLEKLKGKGFSIPSQILAEIYFKCGRYDRAVELWGNNCNEEHYYIAQEYLSEAKGDEDARIEWINKQKGTIQENAKKMSLVYKYGENQGVDSLSDTSKAIIFYLLLETKDMDKAMAFHYYSNEKEHEIFKIDKVAFLIKRLFPYDEDHEVKYKRYVLDWMKEYDTKNTPIQWTPAFFDQLVRIPQLREKFLYEQDLYGAYIFAKESRQVIRAISNYSEYKESVNLCNILRGFIFSSDMTSEEIYYQFGEFLFDMLDEKLQDKYFINVSTAQKKMAEYIYYLSNSNDVALRISNVCKMKEQLVRFGAMSKEEEMQQLYWYYTKLSEHFSSDTTIKLKKNYYVMVVSRQETSDEAYNETYSEAYHEIIDFIQQNGTKIFEHLDGSQLKQICYVYVEHLLDNPSNNSDCLKTMYEIARKTYIIDSIKNISNYSKARPFAHFIVDTINHSNERNKVFYWNLINDFSLFRLIPRELASDFVCHFSEISKLKDKKLVKNIIHFYDFSSNMLPPSSISSPIVVELQQEYDNEQIMIRSKIENVLSDFEKDHSNAKGLNIISDMVEKIQNRELKRVLKNRIASATKIVEELRLTKDIKESLKTEIVNLKDQDNEVNNYISYKQLESKLLSQLGEENRLLVLDQLSRYIVTYEKVVRSAIESRIQKAHLSGDVTLITSDMSEALELMPQEKTGIAKRRIKNYEQYKNDVNGYHNIMMQLSKINGLESFNQLKQMITLKIATIGDESLRKECQQRMNEMENEYLDKSRELAQKKVVKEINDLLSKIDKGMEQYKTESCQEWIRRCNSILADISDPEMKKKIEKNIIDKKNKVMTLQKDKDMHQKSVKLLEKIKMPSDDLKTWLFDIVNCEKNISEIQKEVLRKPLEREFNTYTRNADFKKKITKYLDWTPDSNSYEKACQIVFDSRRILRGMKPDSVLKSQTEELTQKLWHSIPKQIFEQWKKQLKEDVDDNEQ